MANYLGVHDTVWGYLQTLGSPTSLLLRTPHITWQRLADVVVFDFFVFLMGTACFHFRSYGHLHYHLHFSHIFRNCLPQWGWGLSSVPVTFTQLPLVCVLTARTRTLLFMFSYCWRFPCHNAVKPAFAWVELSSLECFSVQISILFSP